MNPYKNSLRPVGVLITLVAGALQYIFWFVAWAKWLGVLGVILGFLLTPGVMIFPIIYWDAGDTLWRAPQPQEVCSSCTRKIVSTETTSFRRNAVPGCRRVAHPYRAEA
jgi:hypothetical protein